MTDTRYDVFISYRRAGGSELAQLVRSALAKRGYRVFVDVRELAAGPFDAALTASIEQSANFVIPLTPGCLDRCRNEGDWLRQEIALALATGRNVVPMRSESFSVPQRGSLPADIAGLAMHHCVTYSHEHSDASLEKLCALLHPPPRRRRRRMAIASAVAVLVPLVLLGVWLAGDRADGPGAVLNGSSAEARPAGISPSRNPAVNKAALENIAPDAASGTTDLGRLPPLGLYWYGFGQRLGDGAWREFTVQDGATMYSGDQFRLVFSPSEDCFAYVIGLDAAGQLSVLFPSEAILQGNRCQRNRHYEIPDGANWFTLDETTGAEALYLVASYDPLDALQKVIAAKEPSEVPGQAGRRIETALRSLEDSQRQSPQTRSGQPIDLRGVTIKSDQRLAKGRLQDGSESSRTMEFVLGSVHAVKRIHFEHRKPKADGRP